MDKKELRNVMLTKRMALPLSHKQILDQKISNIVKDYYDGYSTIALYCSTKNEVDTYGLMEHWFWDKHKRIVCPRIENNEMVFVEVKSFEDLEMGHFGILEPKGTEIVDKTEIEVMLVPLLAFDADYYRLGYGKGYYDQYLSGYPGIKVGLAYKMQQVDSVFRERHDVMLDGVITENLFT